MGMVPEAAVAMLACARLGACAPSSSAASPPYARPHPGLWRRGGHHPGRGLRGSRTVPLKATADAGRGERSVKHMVVVKRTGGAVAMADGRDVWWHDVVAAASTEHEAVEWRRRPLHLHRDPQGFKGVVRTCGGYITYPSYTHQVVFDLREDDVYACVADVGWITGHSYIVYRPSPAPPR